MLKQMFQAGNGRSIARRCNREDGWLRECDGYARYSRDIADNSIVIRYTTVTPLIAARRYRSVGLANNRNVTVYRFA